MVLGRREMVMVKYYNYDVMSHSESVSHQHSEKASKCPLLPQRCCIEPQLEGWIGHKRY